MITFQDLQDEILEMIFDRLSHSSKLIARLTCTKWNKEILPSLCKTSKYELCSKESLQILLDSKTPWSGLKLCFAKASMCLLPARHDLGTHISALDLDLRVFPRYRSTLIYLFGFPNVTDLTIRVCQEDNSNNEIEKLLSSREFDDGFKTLAKNLCALKLKIPFNKYRALTHFLTKLDIGERLRLIEFCIIEEMCQVRLLTPTQPDFPFEQLKTILFKSAQTLKTLRLDFYALNSTLLSEFKRMNLALKDIHIADGNKYPTVWRGNITEYFLAHQEFLDSQKKTLNGVSLPWVKDKDEHGDDDDQLRQELVMEIIPSDIVEISNLCKEHVTLDFGDKFQKLKTLDIIATANTKVFVSNKRFPTVRKLKLQFIASTYSDLVSVGRRESASLANLSQLLVNLTELIIESYRCNIYNGEGMGISASDVQLIIKEFKKLQVLRLVTNVRSEITDFAVTGIHDLHSLVRTRKLYLDYYDGSDYEPDDSELTGSPISSLKHLETLHIKNSRVTDAGIYFGFRFGQSLKHLEFESISLDVSDWGMYWLGENNPGLESFSGKFHGLGFSYYVKEDLESRFPLISYTRKYKFEVD